MSVQESIVDEMQERSAAGKAELALEAVRTYVRVRWLLLRRGLPGTVAALRDTGAARCTDPEPLQKLRGLRIGHGVVRALRVLPADDRCLMRSLVVLGLLARRGIACRLIIGVRSEPSFAAHAWIELDGLPLLEDHAGSYSRLVEL